MSDMILLALLTLTLMTGAASAQSRTIYDAGGKVVGSATTDSLANHLRIKSNLYRNST
jgi:hypothetical protein